VSLKIKGRDSKIIFISGAIGPNYELTININQATLGKVSTTKTSTYQFFKNPLSRGVGKKKVQANASRFSDKT
jgi:hypothetical protein